MALLIDGYNLLHASGILGRGVGPGGLERSRMALLNFLAESLDPRDAAQTIVVFDAGAGSRGLPDGFQHRGLRVRFSSGHADADELIELLIRGDSTPRRLTVVSSDHRLQRAARRRKARAVDSDKWFQEMRRARQTKQVAGPPAAKPPVMLDDAEVRFWLRQFGADESLEIGPTEQGDQPEGSGPTGPNKSPIGSPDSAEIEPDETYNPFPPGYGEDLEL